MDLWVVATAAGAGYLAKYWQHILRDKEGTSGFTSEKSFSDEPQSPSLIERIRDKTCLIKKLSRVREDIGRGDYSGEILSETSMRDDPMGMKASSCSALNHEQEVGSLGNGSLPSLSLFSPEFSNGKKFQQYGDGNGIDADMSSIPEDSTWNMEAPSKKSQRRRRLHLQYIKPRNSLDSCLMAQMHRERVELEEYLLTPLSSPCTPCLRPFLVSDGKRIISRPSGGFMGGLYTNVHPKADNDVVGVPHLPQINAADCTKQKFNHKNRMGKSHYGSSIMQFDTQEGFSSGQALFCLGISIGILSTIIANKVELEKLKVSLKQSEHLVEDLQEELEMKDSVTVKELVNDDYSQDIHRISSVNKKIDVFSNQADMNVLLRYADEESVCVKKHESISNIEAELEAELERLELSMKGSTLSSELNQGFDQDIIAELVHGELQADIVRRRSSSEPTIDRGSNSTSASTPHSAKDGVSPHELTLRLHEVIQSRLEGRIMELEAELAKSQNHIKHLLSDKSNYWRDFSNSGSSSRCSPREPLVMNLSGDALDAYNEAFEKLNSLKEQEDKPSRILVDSQSKESMEDGQTGFHGGSNMWPARKREEAVPISITGIPSSEDSPSDCYNGGDDGDDDDDMLLIMQIVEKARQGSPAILKAQKAMVSLNRDH